MPNFYSKMYGNKTDKNVEPKKEEIKPISSLPAPASKRLRGLKLTNSHMHEIDLNGETVTIPSAAYVKLLEDQIKDVRNNNKSLAHEVDLLRKKINFLNRQIEKITNQLNSSVVVKRK